MIIIRYIKLIFSKVTKITKLMLKKKAWNYDKQISGNIPNLFSLGKLHEGNSRKRHKQKGTTF